MTNNRELFNSADGEVSLLKTVSSDAYILMLGRRGLALFIRRKELPAIVAALADMTLDQNVMQICERIEQAKDRNDG